MRTPDPDDTGQASVELLALLPALGLVIAVAWQALLAGTAWWLSSTAAREAARASALGGDAESAARSALPAPFRTGLRVRSEGGSVTVRVPIPSVVGVRVGSVTVRARMEPQR